MTSATKWTLVAALAVLMPVAFGPTAEAQQPPPPSQQQQPPEEPPPPPEADSKIEGTIYDAVGIPVPSCRVIARNPGGTEVYVSPPSDEQGNYSIAVPSGGSYSIVALVSPTGGRLAMPEAEPLPAGTAHDVHLPMAMGPAPRKNGKNGTDPGAADRLFLSFVEDPALVDGIYLEGDFDYAAYGSTRVSGIDATFAAQFESLPQVEVGARGSFAAVDPDVGKSESGTRDLQLWGKLAFYRSSNNRRELAAGALLTLPTGDNDIGLGLDAYQSKLFVAGSYSFRHAALVGSLGVGVSGNGSVGGIPIEGAVSGAVGLGVVLPLWSKVNLTVEADYQSERFKDFDEEARVGFGINWHVFPHGVVRGAVIGGLVDESADARILAGFAYTF